MATPLTFFLTTVSTVIAPKFAEFHARRAYKNTGSPYSSFCDTFYYHERDIRIASILSVMLITVFALIFIPSNGLLGKSVASAGAEALKNIKMYFQYSAGWVF